MLLRSPQSGARRRGVSLVLLVVSIVSILSVLALSLEGGLLLSERRTAQATADAASMAAAADFYWNWYTNFGTDPNGTAYSSAMYTASQNGYTNDGVNTKVTVNIPPQSGPYTGMAAYAEVIVEYYHTRGFSSLFGTGQIPVRARAVAVGKPNAGEFGILVLDPTSKGAFTISGGASVVVQDTPIIVDSSSQQGSIANGGGTATAPTYFLAGNYATPGGGQFIGTMYVNQLAVPDPLANLPVPDPSKMTVQAKSGTHLTGGTTVLYPGVYTGGIKASGQASVVLMPGIYYMDGGGFQFTGQGSLTGNGVMIYNAPGKGNSSGVDIEGQGQVNLTPPTSGIYQGIVLFQDRTSSVPAKVAGNGSSNLTGTFYFAGAALEVTGNGGFDNIGSQYISYDLNVKGNGQVNIEWKPNQVAQVRLITIVE